MNMNGLKKTVGFSSIEVNKRVYIFTVRGKSCPWDKRIVEVWHVLRDRTNALGYTSDLSSILHDVDDEEKRRCFVIIARNLP